MFPLLVLLGAAALLLAGRSSSSDSNSGNGPDRGAGGGPDPGPNLPTEPGTQRDDRPVKVPATGFGNAINARPDLTTQLSAGSVPADVLRKVTAAASKGHAMTVADAWFLEQAAFLYPAIADLARRAILAADPNYAFSNEPSPDAATVVARYQP